MADEIRTERRDSLLVITIDRPARRNVINAAAAQGVASAIDQPDSDSELFVGVLTGEGGTFSSGMDLKASSRARYRRYPAAASAV